MLQTGLATLELLAFRTHPLARPRAQAGHCTGFLEVHRAMPQDVETQACQLSNKFDHRLGELFSEQVLTLLEGEKLRGLNLCHRVQRWRLVSAWGLGRGLGIRCLCPGPSCHPGASHGGFHNTPKPGSCVPNSICAEGAWTAAPFRRRQHCQQIRGCSAGCQACRLRLDRAAGIPPYRL